MTALQRALPAHTTPFEQYGFVADSYAAANENETATPRDGVTPIYRPQPTEDWLDSTIADSFPCSDPYY